MILNAETLLSDDQAITATAASTNSIDLQAQGIPYGDAAALSYDRGVGEPLPLLFQVTEAFDSAANDGTLTVSVELDSTTTFTPDKTIDLGTFAEADLTTGFILPFNKLPKGLLLQYMRFKYTVAGTGNFTAGKITAGIVHSIQEN